MTLFNLARADCADYASYLHTVSSLDIGRAKDTVLVGERAYLAANEGLLVLDISDPQHPTNAGMVSWWDEMHMACPDGIAVQGDYAYIADECVGLVTVDLRTMSVVRMDMTYLIDLEIVGQYAFATNGDLQVYDLSVPDAPTRVSSLNITGNAERIAIRGGYAYVTTGDVKIIDISNPTAPFNAGGVATPNFAQGIAIEGSNAYVLDTTNDNGVLWIYDLTDPRFPVRRGGSSIPDRIWGGETVAASGTHAYVATNENLAVVDVSNPNAPVRKDHVRILREPMTIVVRWPYAYCGCFNVVDITKDTAVDVISSEESTTYVNDVAVSGNSLYTAEFAPDWSWGGVSVFDVSDPTSLSYRNAVETPGSADAIALATDGPHLFVADGDSGLQVMERVQGWPWLRLVGSVPTARAFRGIALDGSFAYVAGDAGLDVFDVSDPLTPKQVGSARYGARSCDVAIQDHYAYMANHYHGGMTIVDVADPLQPIALATLDFQVPIRGIGVSGTHAFLACAVESSEDFANNGLAVVDIEDPGHPFVEAMLQLPQTAKDVAIAGTSAYVTEQGSYTGYLDVVDVSDPENPRILGGVEPPFAAGGVAVKGEFVYVAVLFRGVAVAPIQCGVPVTVPEWHPATRGVTLLAISPNPMGEAGATIRYTLPNPATVTIDVFNAAGALVRRIDEGARPAGQHSVPWDGRSKNGAALQSGVYVARMLTPEGTTTGRVVLAK
jgi:hypothetical protein